MMDPLAKEAGLAWNQQLWLQRDIERAQKPVPPPPPATALQALEIATWRARQFPTLPGPAFSPPTPTPAWGSPQVRTLGFGVGGIVKGIEVIWNVTGKLASWYNRGRLIYDVAKGAYELATDVPDVSGARPIFVYEETSGRLFSRRHDGTYRPLDNRMF